MSPWTMALMPWSHQPKSEIYVGELVSHNDFHGGPSPSNLHDDTKDGHNLHNDVQASDTWDPRPKTCRVVHMVQLCCPRVILNCWGGRATIRAVVHHIKDVEQAAMLVWITWHPTVVASPTISHPEVDGKLEWIGHEDCYGFTHHHHHKLMVCPHGAASLPCNCFEPLREAGHPHDKLYIT